MVVQSERATWTVCHRVVLRTHGRHEVATEELAPNNSRLGTPCNADALRDLSWCDVMQNPGYVSDATVENPKNLDDVVAQLSGSVASCSPRTSQLRGDTHCAAFRCF
jgi:hypothetical protein